MINCIPNGKPITLTGKNNQKVIQQSIIYENYIYIFVSLKIALSKKFKANILNNFYFINYLSLLAINEIYLIKKLDKSFYFLYTEIKKVKKRILL